MLNEFNLGDRVRVAGEYVTDTICGIWYSKTSRTYNYQLLNMEGSWLETELTISNPHKHAELMMQYAKDAADTPEPYRLWESREYGSSWRNLNRNPLWYTDVEYRRKQ